MSYTHVQTATQGTFGSPETATFASAVTNGNCVIGTVQYTGTATTSLSSVKDNLGNSLTVLDNVFSSGDSVGAASFIVGNVTNGMTGVTCTATGNQILNIVIDEYSGTAALANPVDVHTGQLLTAPGANPISSGNVTTTVANDLIWGGYNDLSQISTSTAGSGFVRRGNVSDATTQTVSSSEDNLTFVGPGTAAGTWSTSATNDNFILFVIAVKPAAGGGATPTWGFSSRREDERPIAPQRSDWAQPWFYPSQIPVPTLWLPTTGQEDRPPPPSRRPDDSSIENRRWFVRSPNPVPTIWLPTTGEEDRPPPIKRPPDEPNGYFFQKPGAVAPPLRWMPTTGEEDRPPNPNRIRAPDEPPTWFRPSQIPVPQQWLPTAGEQDHPFPVKRPPDEPGTFFFQFSAPRTTPNLWLPTTGQEDRPPSPNRVPSPDQFFPWFARSPNPVPTTWLPTTGEEDRPPAQKRPPDEPGTFFFTFKPPVGIAGIAWWRQTEVYLEPVPSYRDYKLSWDPQFIVQVAPSFVEIYSKQFFSEVGTLGHIKRNP